MKFRIWNKMDSKFYNYNPLDTTKWLLDMNGNLGYIDLADFSWGGLIPKGFYEINKYTGLKDKNETKVYEGDLIPYHFNEDVKGVVKCGEYRNPCDDEHATHIGFYVYWEDEKYKNTMRKDLGYWLRVSCVCGNIYENR